MHGVADKARELHHERIVQPQVDAQLRALLRRGVLPDHAGDRIAHIAEHRKGDQCHGQHDQQRLKKSSRYESKHIGCPGLACTARVAHGAGRDGPRRSSRYGITTLRRSSTSSARWISLMLSLTPQDIGCWCSGR
ncbi:Uncharacterised protein [Bordetella pertussis]|nr:Uncharacterised protein [Bordetella pertussis]